MLQCHVTRTFACLCLCLLRPSPFVFVCTCSWHSCVLSVSFIVLRLIKYHAAFLQKLLQTFSHMYSVAPTKMAHFFGQILLNQIAALVLSYFCFKFLKILIIFVSRALIILKLCALRWIWRSRATCATHLILLDFITRTKAQILLYISPDMTLFSLCLYHRFYFKSSMQFLHWILIVS